MKNNISSDVELLTRFSKRAPEPCTTCGRPDQPERFHSHPKIPVIKNKPGVNNLRLNKISIAKKSVQKPVALNFRSDRNKKMEKDLVAKAMLERKSKTLSPLDSKNNPGSISKVGIVKGPRTITCYICSREFGTASFPIHEPKCLEVCNFFYIFLIKAERNFKRLIKRLINLKYVRLLFLRITLFFRDGNEKIKLYRHHKDDQCLKDQMCLSIIEIGILQPGKEVK